MKIRPAVTVITALILMFAWIGQVLAAPCPAMIETSMNFSHAGHDLADATLEHGCADCQGTAECVGTSLHCLKAGEISNTPVAWKIGKATPDLALAPVAVSFKAKNYQNRRPDFFPAATLLLPLSPNSLHIRLQV